ncbi:MAG: hypothetical protein AAFS01_00485 [Pseudomonadota bacterium]
MSIKKVDMSSLTVETDDGLVLKLFDHEYWTLLPTQPIELSESNTRSALRSGIVAHNIKIGKGLALAMDDLLQGISPKYAGGGQRQAAEEALEQARRPWHQDKPSRLRCHYLFYNKSTAKQKQLEWRMDDRFLTRCYLVLNSGRFHHADLEIFEALSNQPENTDLAANYWKTFRPTNAEERARLEVLADSCLYFPDWSTIPTIPVR